MSDPSMTGDLVERLTKGGDDPIPHKWPERSEWLVANWGLRTEAASLITKQADRIAVLEAALRPFAEYLDVARFDLDSKGAPLPDEEGIGWAYLNIGQFRAARNALVTS